MDVTGDYVCAQVIVVSLIAAVNEYEEMRKKFIEECQNVCAYSYYEVVYLHTSFMLNHMHVYLYMYM